MYLDIGVVVIYMGAMLLLGWYGMRRAKTQEDFLVAGRNLGPGFYMGTMAATVLGGASTVGTVRLGYVHGISGFWLCAALGAGIVVLNLFLAKPLLKLRIYTVTQVLERRYSPATRRVSALVMMAYALMLAATSVIATGTVMHVLFDLPFWAAVLLGGGVVVIYSAVGGMWSLTLTDIVQFVIKTVGLMFVLLPICIMRVGGWDQLVAGRQLRLHHHRLEHHRHLLRHLFLRHPDRPGHLAACSPPAPRAWRASPAAWPGCTVCCMAWPAR